MRKTMILMSLLTLFSVSGQAQDNNEAQNESGAQGISNEITVEKADSAYIQGDFLTAISMYEHIIANDGVNATLYMNLGNAWFQQDEIAKAILNYERAYLLDPTDDDIRFNLELARTHTVDKVNPRSELFFNVWFRSVMNWLDVRQWTILTIILFVLFVCCSAVLLFSGKRTVRKISLGLGAFFLCVSEQGYGKRSEIEDYRKTSRRAKGVKTLNVTEKTGKLVSIQAVTDDNDLIIINKSGITLRLDLSTIRVMGRATQGVSLINLGKRNDQIGSVCKVDSQPEEEPQEEQSGEEAPVQNQESSEQE